MDQNKVCPTLGGGEREDGTICIPGCYSPGQQCAEMQRDWVCSFPPGQLRNALEAHRNRGAVKNNEIVVSTRSVTEGLPGSVEAFFVSRGSPDDETQKVVNAHDAFVRSYRLPPELQPPILELDLHGGGLTPFSPWLISDR